MKDSTPSEFPDWDSDSDVANLPTGVYSLRTRIESIAGQVGISSSPTTVTRTLKSRVEGLETSVDGPEGLPENGLNYKVSTLESKMAVVEDEISGSGAGQGSSILNRVQGLEDIVGTPSSPGLGTLCNNVESNNSDISYLRNIVDDPNGGVVANRTDITTLQNAVSDPTTGNAALSTRIQTVSDIVGTPTAGSQLMPLCQEVEQIKSSIVNVYSVKGNCVGATSDQGTDTVAIYVGSTSNPVALTSLENGWVYNVSSSSNPYVEITINGTPTKYYNGTNIVWIKQPVGTSPGYFDELGANIDVSRIDDLEREVDALKDKYNSRFGAIDLGASDTWSSSSLTKSGLYQFTFYFDTNLVTGSFMLPISNGAVRGTTTFLNLVETSNNFITDNFVINSGVLSKKITGNANPGRLSWTIIGETVESL